jgi:hypothetical protein
VQTEQDLPYFKEHSFYSERRRLDDKKRFEELDRTEQLRATLREERNTLTKYNRRERAVERTVCCSWLHLSSQKHRIEVESKYSRESKRERQIERDIQSFDRLWAPL